MNEVISMSIKELDRLKILEELQKKQINQSQASDSLGLSTRQIRRLIKAYKAHGAVGIISQKRGRPGNRQLPQGIKDLALALIEENYADFGPTLAQEKLSKVDNLRVSVSLVRGLMISKGLWKERKKKEGKHS